MLCTNIPYFIRDVCMSMYIYIMVIARRKRRPSGRAFILMDCIYIFFVNFFLSAYV